jgi:hypothetical protein
VRRDLHETLMHWKSRRLWRPRSSWACHRDCKCEARLQPAGVKLTSGAEGAAATKPEELEPQPGSTRANTYHVESLRCFLTQKPLLSSPKAVTQRATMTESASTPRTWMSTKTETELALPMKVKTKPSSMTPEVTWMLADGRAAGALRHHGCWTQVVASLLWHQHRLRQQRLAHCGTVGVERRWRTVGGG